MRWERTVSEHADPVDVEAACEPRALRGVGANVALHHRLCHPQPPLSQRRPGRRLHLEKHRSRGGLAAATGIARGGASTAAVPAETEVEPVQPERGWALRGQ